MRKVLGARRGQLIRQFLGESFVMACGSLVLALGLTVLLLPAFGNLTEKELVVGLDTVGFIVPVP